MNKRALLLLIGAILSLHSISRAGGWITSGVRAASPAPLIPAGPLHYSCTMVASSSDSAESYTLTQEFTPERFDQGSVTFRAPTGPEKFLAGQSFTLQVLRNSYDQRDTVYLTIEAEHQGKTSLEASVTRTLAPREQRSISANVQWRSSPKKGATNSRRESVNLSVDCREL